MIVPLSWKLPANMRLSSVVFSRCNSMWLLLHSKRHIATVAVGLWLASAAIKAIALNGIS